MTGPVLIDGWTGDESDICQENCEDNEWGNFIGNDFSQEECELKDEEHSNEDEIVECTDECMGQNNDAAGYDYSDEVLDNQECREQHGGEE